MRPSEWQGIPFTSGNLRFTKRLWLPKDVTGGGGGVCSVYSRKSTSLRSPLVSGRTKASISTCPLEHAAYLAKPDYIATKKDLTPSTAPLHDDPLSRHRLSYLNGGGGNGKTSRAIELFRTENLPRLARGLGCPRPALRSFAAAIRGSRLQSPEKCHTTGSASMPTITRRSR